MVVVQHSCRQFRWNYYRSEGQTKYKMRALVGNNSKIISGPISLGFSFSVDTNHSR